MGDDGTQNYLVFQPAYKYFETSNKNNFILISSWKSKGLSNEKISIVTGTEFPRLLYDNAKIKVKFEVGSILKQNKVTYNNGPVVNIYTVYKLFPDTKDSSITLKNCLFGAIKMTKKADVVKYEYSGYGVGFDSQESFIYPDGRYELLFLEPI